MGEIVSTKLIHRTAKGTLLKSSATLEYCDGRIYFLKSPFALKDEIKAMRGSKWHGNDEDDGRKIWSIEDCQRNRFQLGWLQGDDVYAWFDRDLIHHDYKHTYLNGEPVPMMAHQVDLADHGLTYHYQLWAAEMGTGKTLAAQKVIEMSGVRRWWWVGPKSSIPNIKREFRRWGFDFGAVDIDFLTYDALTDRMDAWRPGDPIPQGVIFDESSRLKGYTSQRTRASMRLADLIREKYNFDGYVIEMSGTPSPKSPVDWWSQTEIAWPGYLKEGSPKALEQRCAFIVQQEYDSGTFPKRIGWKDDAKKCKHCGFLYYDGDHEIELCDDIADFHEFEASVNEVAYLHERLKGLVVVKHKKDCLTLPDKRRRKIICKPSASTVRVAKALADAAPNTMTGLTWLRELSDGFQYRDIPDGMTRCTHCPDACGMVDEWFHQFDENRVFRAIDMLDEELVSMLEKRNVPCPDCKGSGEVEKRIRISKEIACPKDKALKMLLDECEETGRIVIFAGFTGSVDRIVKLLHSKEWDVVRCDGRGFQITTRKGEVITNVEALDYWADLGSNARVGFVAHPESGGMSLTLVESRMAVFWSNSFKPEFRVQAEDRIHRKGMDENLGCEIVDLVHLPTDERVLDVIQENRKLELMSMGDFMPSLMSASVTENEEGEVLVEV